MLVVGIFKLKSIATARAEQQQMLPSCRCPWLHGSCLLEVCKPSAYCHLLHWTEYTHHREQHRMKFMLRHGAGNSHLMLKTFLESTLINERSLTTVGLRLRCKVIRIHAHSQSQLPTCAHTKLLISTVAVAHTSLDEVSDE